MNFITQIDPDYFALLILCTATTFTGFWLLYSLTHAKLVKVDLTDKELTTHRIILATSLLMETSLVLMYWFNMAMLPIFIGLFITRTVHEFIDELHWHTDRCTPYESMLHLGMWISILINTAAMFIWGFLTQYNGLEQLPPAYFIWAGIIGITISVITVMEWKR